MPYVITTRQHVSPGERIVVDALESVGTRVVIAGEPIVSRVAVATLEEARRAIVDTYGGVYGYLVALSESGGTVGPLPDGTIIDVMPVSWTFLFEEQGLADNLSQASALAAFNAS